MTYSIVARDPETGQLGAAVQSHFFGVGRIVPWAEAGVGVVVTQSVAEAGYGPRGLAALRAGTAPTEALAALVAVDPAAALRQVAMVDASGASAVHTGVACVAHASHAAAEGVSAQANMMARDTVPAAMIEAYAATSGDLAQRLLAALDAAEAEGGDIRGRQSAAILVVSGERSDAPWDQRLVDLRVDDSSTPLPDLRRLVDYNRAFTLVSSVFFSGILFAPALEPAAPELQEALTALGTAQQTLGDNLEPTFWQSVLLAKAGRIDEARSQLKLAAESNAAWPEFLRRLPASGLLAADNELLDN